MNTNTSNTVMYIGADPKKNAGEVDYLKALSLVLRDNSSDSKHIVCKIPSAETTAFDDNKLKIMENAHILPTTNEEYAHVPPYSEDILPRDGTLTVIGVGQSTLDTLKEIQNALTDTVDVTFAYVTHMLDTENDWLAQNNVKIFTPASQEKIVEADPVFGPSLDLHTLDAVPHTNTLEACYLEYTKFQETENGKVVHQLMMDKKPIAFSVINAGFAIGDTYHPYTEEEAYAHGAALGEGLAPGTALLAAHGGPRNLKDENEFGQKTMSKYIEGYLAAQNAKGANPVIIEEKFAFGLPYNAIKAGYIMAQAKNCIAFISNGEGYGTMDGATALINSSDTLVGTFSFNAIEKDPTGQRQENTIRYYDKGITLLSNEDGKLVTKSNPNAVPAAKGNPAEVILKELGLVQNIRPFVPSFAAPMVS